jgi:hypothetical protein
MCLKRSLRGTAIEWVAVILTFLVPGAAACRANANILRVPVGSALCREIRIIERAGSMAADALAAVDADGKLVLPPLPRELAQIQDVLVSPGKNLALVISVGEGHPWINVYRIADWMATPTPGNEGVEPFRSMDPYPFDWADIAWKSPNELRFRSAGDYARFDPAARRPGGDIGAPIRTWIWDTGADTVRSE